ncbi:MAG: MFS transporter [Candidatus Woesearchaeota archaeon]|nr:MAG: MFS transporter [Candidatus Woesearchaeota archaeon]
MAGELDKRILSDLRAGKSSEEITESYLSEGMPSEEIDNALENALEKYQSTKDSSNKRNRRIILSKEILDKIAFGFSNHQVVNIIFYLIGAPFLLIGIITGLRNLFSTGTSLVISDVAEKKDFSKKFISSAGIIFGFSFVFLALATAREWLWLFSLAVLAGSIAVVPYGNLYKRIIQQTISKQRMGFVLAKIASVGTILTALTIYLGAWILDNFPFEGRTIGSGKLLFSVTGYVLIFEITAICFILSGYLLSKLKETDSGLKKKWKSFWSEKAAELKESMHEMSSIPYMSILLFGSVLVSAIQIVTSTFYGIYIFDMFGKLFLPVATVFAVGIIVSFAGPMITKKVNKAIGLAPMMVFGSILVTFMPLTLLYNKELGSISAAFALAIIGSSIVGLGQALITRKLLSETQKKKFFRMAGYLSLIPVLIIVLIGAIVAQLYGLDVLFMGAIIATLVLVTPTYFLLVIKANKLAKERRL